MNPSPRSVYLRRFFLAVLFLPVFLFNSFGAIPPSELAALEAIYTSTNGPGWATPPEWRTGLPDNQWVNVTVTGGTVTAINFTNNNLEGVIPPEIVQLPNLRILILSGNKLSGTLPNSFYSLTNLIEIRLSRNAITGSISNKISQLSKLTTLDLSYNQLTGAIPVEIGQLKDLSFLQLSDNQLTGTIPNEIGNLTKLTSLDLQGNQLTGKIPVTLKNLALLSNLILRNNKLTGPIPNELYSITSLTGLYLSNNIFGGSLSPLIRQLINLEQLNVQNCGLSGPIPVELGKLNNLNTLNLSRNSLSGTIPTELSNLTDLNVLNLRQNNLTGTIPPGFSNLTKLNNLNLGKNNFTGDIPSAFSGFAGLAQLAIDSNQFENIPAFTQLTELFWCGSNRLTFGDLAGSSVLVGRLDTLFRYSPQAKFGIADTVTAIENAPFTLTIPCPGNPNKYQWHKDGSTITNYRDDYYLNFTKVSFSDEGSYHVTVKNNLFPDLVLTSQPVHLDVVEHCLKRDSLALVALYNATNGPNWTRNDNWLKPGSRVKDWFGITADSCAVTRIVLPNNHLVGNFPVELTKLAELSHLDLDSNAVSGNIPAEIGLLSNLAELKLANNQLAGVIPKEIGNLSNLVILRLPNNQLEGEIPREIGNLINLTGGLSLDNNKLSGSIPSEIGNLKKISSLFLSVNQLSGEIPEELWQLTNLEDIWIDHNRLSGGLSPAVGQMTNLHGLNLSANQLSGSIPNELGSLTKLDHLELSQNNFTGELPAELGNLKEMKRLWLFMNSFTGELPVGFGEFENLEEFWISQNGFTGVIPNSFSQLQRIRSFKIEENFFTEVPSIKTDSAGYFYSNNFTFEDLERNLALKRMPKLDFQYAPQRNFGKEDTIIIVEGTPLTITIPCGGIYNHYKWFKDGIRMLADDASSLVFPRVELSDSGAYHITVINDSVTNLTLQSLPIHLFVREHCIKFDSLALVALYNATNGPNWTHNDNWLTGMVKTWYGIQADSCFVMQIDLKDNNLTGKIPVEVCTLPKLNLFDARNNNLEGEIPGEIGNLQELAYLDISENNLSGKIPAGIGNLAKLSYLNFAYNNLGGSIPSEIGNLASLRSLHLEINKLSGRIPDEIGLLTTLYSLNLEGNELSGAIPASIGNLVGLDHAFLSHNRLEGTIPAELGQLSSIQHLFLHNNQLSGSVPTSINNLVDLKEFTCNDNSLTDIPSFLGIDSLISCFDNYLTFEDFERNLPLHRKAGFTYTYSPQYEFGREYDTIALRKYPFTLAIPTQGVYNHYKWYKNDELLATAPDSYTLTIARVDYSDEGDYYIKVTNDSVPNLELTSLPVTVNVEKGPPLPIDLINVVVIDGSHNSMFMIENIDDYPENDLTVLTKWGKTIYRKESYNNELDLSKYPAGTYYFVLNYTTAEGKQQVRNFVEVIKK